MSQHTYADAEPWVVVCKVAGAINRVYAPARIHTCAVAVAAATPGILHVRCMCVCVHTDSVHPSWVYAPARVHTYTRACLDCCLPCFTCVYTQTVCIGPEDTPQSDWLLLQLLLLLGCPPVPRPSCTCCAAAGGRAVSTQPKVTVRGVDCPQNTTFPMRCQLRASVQSMHVNHSPEVVTLASPDHAPLLPKNQVVWEGGLDRCHTHSLTRLVCGEGGEHSTARHTYHTAQHSARMHACSVRSGGVG